MIGGGRQAVEETGTGQHGGTGAYRRNDLHLTVHRMDPLKQRFDLFRPATFIEQWPGPARTRYHQEVKRLAACAFEIPIGRDRRTVDAFHLAAILTYHNNLERIGRRRRIRGTEETSDGECLGESPD